MGWHGIKPARRQHSVADAVRAGSTCERIRAVIVRLERIATPRMLRPASVICYNLQHQPRYLTIAICASAPAHAYGSHQQLLIVPMCSGFMVDGADGTSTGERRSLYSSESSACSCGATSLAYSILGLRVDCKYWKRSRQL